VAVLLRLAERLSGRPENAPTTVELVFFASEEERTLGSWHYTHTSDLPSSVAAINLELAGGSDGFAYIPVESLVLRRFRPPQPLIDLVDGAAREHLGERVVPAPIPAFSYTDARSFLAHGIPSITLMARFEHGFARGLHSARDTRDRVSQAALERTVALLQEIVARVDARPDLVESRSPRR
jgi:Zn-dependent M28 family amino/carboxypeptidase